MSPLAPIILQCLIQRKRFAWTCGKSSDDSTAMFCSTRDELGDIPMPETEI